MIELDIPGMDKIKIRNLVLDYNGTIAQDGFLLPKVKDTLCILQSKLDIHIITADTFGSVVDQVKDIKCEVFIIPKEDQIICKQNYVNKLKPEETIAIGNGKNDKLMLEKATIGICVIQVECAYAGTVNSANIISTNIVSALELLLFPKRLVATLRT